MALIVTLHLGALKRYKRQVEAGSPGMKRTLEAWAKVHREALSKRYEKYSRGGGGWIGLASSTIFKKGHDAILIDTGRMIAALGPGKPFGSYTRLDVKNGRVSIGFSRVQHSRGKAFSEIAGYHQRGTAKMPQRKILVGPNNETKKKMKEIADDILGKEAHKFMPPPR